jgi:hypothetical protein
MARLARRLRVHLHLLDLAGVKHAIELLLQQLARLPVQHLEHLAAERVLARDALGSRLALAVPGANPVGAVDHVQADRQRIDDPCHEVALRFQLARAQRDFRGEVLR